MFKRLTYNLLLLSEIFNFSKYHSVIIIILSTISAFLNSVLTLSLFPLVRELGKEKIENRILVFYDNLLNYFNFENSLNLILLFMVVSVLLNAIVLLSIDYYISNITTRLNIKIKKNYFNSILKSNWNFFLEKKPGEMVNSLFEETNKTITCYRDLLELIVFFVQLVIFILLSFYISFFVTIFSIISGIIIIFIFLSWSSKAKNAGYNFNEIYKNFYSGVLEAIKNIKTSKATGKTNKIIYLFENYFNNFRKTDYKMHIVLSIPKRFSEPLLVVMLCILVVYIVERKILNIQEFIPLIYLFIRITSAFSNLQGKFQSIKKTEPFYTSYKRNLTTSINMKEENKGNEKFSFKEKIIIENLNFKYKNNLIFKDFSCTLYKNKINIITGPSGRGKTTLIDILARLQSISDGTVKIDKTELKNFELNNYRNNLAYVTQESFFYNDSIINNLTLDQNKIDQKIIQSSLEVSCCSEFINNLENGLNEVIGENGSKLSVGQKQRLSIARALILEPKILLLEEATASLNNNIKKQLLENLKKTTLNKSMTIIATTHDIIWNDFADNVINI